MAAVVMVSVVALPQFGEILCNFTAFTRLAACTDWSRY
jgi:hypothetical protein